MNLYTNRSIPVDKIINQLLYRKNMVWRNLNPAKVSAKYMGKVVNTETFLYRLNFVLGNPRTVDLSRLSLNDKETILCHADKALAHEFDILGSGWVKLDPIEWHSDFKTGKQWPPKAFYRDYNIIAPAGGYDIKTVWDLNRCHHLVWLAEAYRLTNDTRYASEIVDEIKGWIDENPLMYSVNWTCSMDVAIRAINWMYAICLISDAVVVDNEFCHAVSKSLYEHGFFIINNLEKTIPYSGNHYLSDLVGLLFIFSIFPDNRFARYCFNFAKSEFIRETLIELSSDGTNYEHSVSYHRLVTELFIYGYTLLTRLNISVPANVQDRMVKAIDYVAAYTKRNGKSPLIGDNDNGRVVAFMPRDFRHHSYICSLGYNLFGREYNGLEKDTIESMMLSAGIKVKDKWTQFETSSVRIFPDNKLAIVKDGDLELFVTNSPFSLNRGLTNIPNGTHTHPDALSFDLSFGREDFIVDPGTYVYTSEPDMRRQLMETKSHNTIVVDNLNQTKLSATNVFVQSNYVQNHRLDVESSTHNAYISGSYDYDDGKTKYSHSRTFTYEGNSLKITDILECTGKHDILLNFTLSPNISPSIENGMVRLNGENGVAEIMVSCNEQEVKPKIERAYFSPSYGILEETDSLKFHASMNNKLEIITIISWKKK